MNIPYNNPGGATVYNATLATGRVPIPKFPSTKITPQVQIKTDPPVLIAAMTVSDCLAAFTSTACIMANSNHADGKTHNDNTRPEQTL